MSDNKSIYVPFIMCPSIDALFSVWLDTVFCQFLFDFVLLWFRFQFIVIAWDIFIDITFHFPFAHWESINTRCVWQSFACSILSTMFVLCATYLMRELNCFRIGVGDSISQTVHLFDAEVTCGSQNRTCYLYHCRICIQTDINHSLNNAESFQQENNYPDL